jgi:hypothetical protein
MDSGSESELPKSIRPFIWNRPQDPQGLSPTASSPGAQGEPETRIPTFVPPRLPPVLPPARQAGFPDPRRQYSGYESGAHDPVSLPQATRLPAPERLAGPSSIPHGSASRYRSPAASDPIYPAAVRQQGPSAYAGSRSLPALSQITGVAGHWREGEAGPSSLVHSQLYGGVRRPSPNYLSPQPIYRRATEPGGYSNEGTHVQREQIITHLHSEPSLVSLADLFQLACTVVTNVLGNSMRGIRLLGRRLSFHTARLLRAGFLYHRCFLASGRTAHRGHALVSN